MSKLNWKNLIIPTNFVFTLSPLLLPWWFFEKICPSSYPFLWNFHSPPAFKKGGVLETMCIHLKVYETAFVSFCVFLLQHFDFFWYGFLQICKLWRNQNARQEISSALSPRITNPRKLFKSDKTKGLPSFWEVKIFEWFKNILPTIWTYKIWMKFLLGNKLNDLCHETLYFLVFKYFLFSFVSTLMQVLKYFFNWGSSFWLTLFWICSLEFLSIIIDSANWGSVFNLEIPFWLLLDTMLSNLFCHFVLV